MTLTGESVTWNSAWRVVGQKRSDMEAVVCGCMMKHVDQASCPPIPASRSSVEHGQGCQAAPVPQQTETDRQVPRPPHALATGRYASGATRPRRC